MEPELDYHTRRARDELHYGLTAALMPAARAHLCLAALHMQRVREFSPTRCKPLLQM